MYEGKVIHFPRWDSWMIHEIWGAKRALKFKEGPWEIEFFRKNSYVLTGFLKNNYAREAALAEHSGY